MADRQTYRDNVKCPQGHRFWMLRRKTTAGKKVTTYCFRCNRNYSLLAGENARASTGTKG